MSKTTSKRYWLFAFMHYYPSGGMDDLEFTFDTLEEFEEYMGGDANMIRWADEWQLYDKLTDELTCYDSYKTGMVEDIRRMFK